MRGSLAMALARGGGDAGHHRMRLGQRTSHPSRPLFRVSHTVPARRVRLLQQRLAALAYYPGPADGQVNAIAYPRRRRSHRRQAASAERPTRRLRAATGLSRRPVAGRP